MGDTWITDITHYEDILDPTLDVPRPVRRLGEFFGTIVGATTAWPFPDQPRTTGLRCRRRPNRKPCPGLLRVILVEDEGYIAWACSSCDDSGLISGWRGSHWDLSPADEDDEERRITQAADEALDVVLAHDEYAALLRIPWFDDDVRRTILAAQADEDEVDLWGTEEELDDLIDAVAGEANHEPQRRWRNRLDGVFDKIETVLKAGGRGERTILELFGWPQRPIIASTNVVPADASLVPSDYTTAHDSYGSFLTHFQRRPYDGSYDPFLTHFFGST